MCLLESGEMYLETILILSDENKPVRSVDVADYMNFSKPSVSRAVGKLKNDGYIEMNDAGHITLTPLGRETACKIYERHTILTAFLEGLGVSHETAVNDACKIEHDISDETFEIIKSKGEKS